MVDVLSAPPMPRLPLLAALALLSFGCSSSAPSLSLPASVSSPQPASGLPTIAKKTDGMDRRDGMWPLFWDAKEGKVWMEIAALDADLLYVTSLAAGLGSNDVGLDRSKLTGTRVVRFERVGPRILMVQPNLDYRAESDNAAERLAVADAFAASVVWAFDVAAETDGRVLVDATAFVVRDAQGVAQTLRGTGQGAFSLDAKRSALVPTMLKAFPQNSEMEARLTFASSAPGREVRSVAADAEAVTVRARHSLVALPDDGYSPRAFDPASGYFAMSYADYAAPIGEDLTQRLITRHRLECAGAPDASGMCDAREPIVYYLDPGTPEPVRSALLDGARWWADAFEAAGFRDGYRVEVRPDSVDPLDVRYSTIQWVHRSTRGWSYGASVVDPRTGEILKGHVSLGSLRVRQDYLIAEGLLSPYAEANADGFADEASDPMLQLALARLRQLSAHEVGHTIGLAHNFAGSTQDRSTVMDYPAPLVTLVGGDLDLSDAYGVGVGPWDVQAVRYGYAHDTVTMQTVLRENRERGLRYLSDTDARPTGAATPYGALWDNGTNAAQALRDQMAVRRDALARFGEAAIRNGRPLATLEEALVPLYLGHRYQVDAAAHLVGGVSYAYTQRGDGSAAMAPVDARSQNDALDALLATVAPSALALPPTLRSLIPPRPPGYGRTRELFDGRTGLTFDPIAPAETGAALTFGYLLDATRATRLAYQPAQDADLPSFTDLLERTTAKLANGAQSDDTYLADIRKGVWTEWTRALMELSSNTRAASAVRATTDAHLDRMARDLSTGDDHARWLSARIARYLARDYAPDAELPRALTPPPGSPIGN